MSHNYTHHPTPSDPFSADALRIEAVTTSVGFDDILDVTLTANHAHFDSMIVVGAGDDTKTRDCCYKHNAIFVESHLFKLHGRNFNKGAAINQGFGHFQYNGLRLHLDSDIMLPDSFRRVMLNHTHLDRKGLYHADRTDLVGWDEINSFLYPKCPQHHHNVVQSHHHRPIRERFVHPLYGFVPIGYFQMWHASEQKSYPHGLGTAAHDDVLFAVQWAPEHRHLLPSVIVGHVCAKQPQFAENWEGRRGQPRLDKKM